MKPGNSVYVFATLSVMVFFCLCTSLVFPSIAASDQNAPLVPTSQPPGLGCWVYTVSSPVWVSVPCVESNATASQTNSTALAEGSGFGVEGAKPSTTCCIASGEEQVTFSQYSGEYDSGTNVQDDWSIQLNTNTFTGNNGQTDWVQFAYCQPCNGGNYLCVWQNDLSVTNGYHPGSCASISKQTLSSSYSAYVEGAIPTCYNCHDLSDEFCVSSTCTSVVQTDTYGLYNNNWLHVSGDILGAGGGSEAVFTSPVSVYTGTTATEFQKFSITGITDYTTGEWNNLGYYSTGTSCGTYNGLQQSCTENAYSN